MKSDCQNLRTLLEEYLDRDPATPVTGDLAAHLDECARCRHEVEQEQRLRASFASLPDLSCPPQVAEFLEAVPHSSERVELSSTVEESGTHWWSQLGIPIWQPAVFAAAAAIVLILVPTSPDQPGTEPASQKYTQAELRVARQQAESTLLYALGVIQNSKKETIGGILGEQLPQAIKGSLRKTWERTQGGQG